MYRAIINYVVAFNTPKYEYKINKQFRVGGSVDELSAPNECRVLKLF